MIEKRISVKMNEIERKTELIWRRRYLKSQDQNVQEKINKRETNERPKREQKLKQRNEKVDPPQKKKPI